MSLEKQIEENTLAIRELTAAIQKSTDISLGVMRIAQDRMKPVETTSQILYESVLSEFTALQSLNAHAAAFLLNDNGVRAVNQLPASQYAAFLDDIATVRADVVKKLAASQESTTAPIVGTSLQEPDSAQDATTGGDEGKKLEQDAPIAESTTAAVAYVQSSIADKPVFTEYQQVADEFLKFVKTKGRDSAIELLTAFGVKTAKELKPEQFQAFGEAVLAKMQEEVLV